MRWLIILMAGCFFSCSGNSPGKGEVLPEEKMKYVLLDMIKADELALQNKLADSTINIKNESFKLYEQVFAVHKTSRKQFYDSYRYYQQHPALYKKLMEAVNKLGEKEKKATQTAPAK